MEDFWLYFKLGFNHVLDVTAYDHVLFIAVLVAAYSLKQWKRIIALVSLFTVGHCLSLALAAFDILDFDKAIIEFLIPLSIVFTAIFNLFTAGKDAGSTKSAVLYIVTLFFGLVHGFGFSTYFNMLSEGASDIALMLLEFALGIEASQLVVVLVILILSAIFQTLLRFSKRDWVLIISSIVLGLSLPLLFENWIF
ncbi:HupE/UreJ family protein [Psychroflexus sp. ALD_RP9]|uniref:HupE/UreJ family protein n=1 Tax=Psychroflexus sp. ALD_RP9 TaxID=2777186 RepID=UPI001A8E74E6|nr:HupE/UreJ family protein [Psychroflexus sp. ALD_RP9]QSS98065.1 HupE/UreJ family protein [Psychroflexus sp. ALD_RP9]